MDIVREVYPASKAKAARVRAKKLTAPRRAGAVVKIENAACPRHWCDGDLFFDHKTQRLFCPKCIGVAARQSALSVKGGAK